MMQFFKIIIIIVVVFNETAADFCQWTWPFDQPGSLTEIWIADGLEWNDEMMRSWTWWTPGSLFLMIASSRRREREEEQRDEEDVTPPYIDDAKHREIFFFFFFDTLCVLTHAGSNKWCWSWGEAPKTWIQLPRMLQHRWGSQSVTEAAATGRAERCHLLIGLKTEDYQQITMSCRAEADR